MKRLGYYAVIGLSFLAFFSPGRAWASVNVAAIVPGTCGNGVRELPEACDGDDLAGLSCLDFGYVAGELACSPLCTFSTAACVAASPTPPYVPPPVRSHYLSGYRPPPSVLRLVPLNWSWPIELASSSENFPRPIPPTITVFVSTTPAISTSSPILLPLLTATDSVASETQAGSRNWLVVIWFLLLVGLGALFYLLLKQFKRF